MKSNEKLEHSREKLNFSYTYRPSP